MAKSSATVATPAQSKRAEKDSAGPYDNFIKGMAVDALFSDAYKNDQQSDKLKGYATYEAAFICLVVYERHFGRDPNLRYTMGLISTQKSFGTLDGKRRGDFINLVCRDAKLVNPSDRVIDNVEEKEAAIREWKSKRALITRGLDFACDLIESGSSLQHALSAGECAMWWDDKTKAFIVPWQSLITKGFRPVNTLYGMIHGDPGGEPPIPANKELRLPLDGTWYMERSSTAPPQDKSFQCTAERIRVVASTKREDQRAKDERHRQQAKGAPPPANAPANTGANAGQSPTGTVNPDGSPNMAPAAAGNGPGRPDGSASPPGGELLDQKTMAKAVQQMDAKTIFVRALAILSEPTAFDPVAVNNYWSNDPLRPMIENLERACRAYRERFAAYEANDREQKRAAQAAKIRMTTPDSVKNVPTMPTKTERTAAASGDNTKSAAGK